MRKRHVIPFLATVVNADELIDVGKDLCRPERKRLDEMLNDFWYCFGTGRQDFSMTGFEGDGSVVWFYITNEKEKYAVCCLPTENRVEIILPSFNRFDVAELDALRSVINDMNSDPNCCRIFYQYDEEDHALYVSANIVINWNA